MTDKEKSIIAQAEEYVSGLFLHEATGHDISHTLRVLKNAESIQASEGGNLFLISLASLLHDADDIKLFPEEQGRLLHASAFSDKCGLKPTEKEAILQIISEVSFKGQDTPSVPSSLEGKIVQDADRLDALGALGIARAFAYGGAKGRKMYDPSLPPQLHMDEKQYRASQGTTINHFYEKLLLLPDLMNTQAGKKAAERRKEYMVSFLEEFYAEWDGKK
jgi:uncharacterized protein